MNLDVITPVILTYNEAPNLERTLAGLTWAKRIVVVDSFSADDTVRICERFPQLECLQRRFDDHTSQWNFGLDHVATEWALSLDADYVLSPAFQQELARLTPPTDVVGYDAPFRYLVAGQPLRGSLYPPRVVLFRRACATYRADGHTQRLEVRGEVAHLTATIDHDDRKPLSRWLISQDKYAQLEASKLLATPVEQLRLQDRVRRSGIAAVPLTLLYTLFVKGLVLDGWRGWYYVLQRTLAEVLLALRLTEKRWRSTDSPPNSP